MSPVGGGVGGGAGVLVREMSSQMAWLSATFRQCSVWSRFLCVCRDASGSPGLDQEPLWPRLAPFFNCEAGEADKPFPRDDPLRSRTDQRWEPQKQWLWRQLSTHFSPCLPGLNETHQRCHRGGELSHGCPGSRCRSVKGADSFHLSQPSLQQAFTAFMEKVTVSWGPSPCPGSPSS